MGGKGANQAIAITRAGGIAEFYGTVGHDGLEIKRKVAGFGLDNSGILVADVGYKLFISIVHLIIWYRSLQVVP